jgi:hypothetical protein
MPLKEVVGGGVFIASNHFLAVAVFAGDGHTEQSGGALNMHCSLSGARHVSTPVGVWSELTVGTLVL